MIGLQLILELYGVQHKDLAEELGIAKQNISFWIKHKKNIPTKYLPVLEKKFNLSREYLTLEITEKDIVKMLDVIRKEL